MRPFLFTLGDVRIPSFFFFIMVATLVSTLYVWWVAKKGGWRPEVILDMGMIGMVAGVLGARIFHILVEAPDYYWQKPMRVFEFWRGGFVSYGGFIAIAVSFWAYFRIRKLPMGDYFDLLAVGAPIIKFFVRVACLLTGCCYGKPTDLPWAMIFTHRDSTAYYFYPHIPLHPTQVYSILHAILLFFFINWIYRRRKFPGQTSALLVMGWALPRAFIEFFRGDSDRGVYFSGLLSTAQIVGIILFVMAVVAYFLLARKEKNPHETKNP